MDVVACDCCLRGMVGFHQVTFDGKNILCRVTGKSHSIESVSMIIFTVCQILLLDWREEVENVIGDRVRKIS